MLRVKARQASRRGRERAPTSPCTTETKMTFSVAVIVSCRIGARPNSLAQVPNVIRRLRGRIVRRLCPESVP